MNFVNSNKPNVDLFVSGLSDELKFEHVPDVFSESFAHDVVNESAFPVYVYYKDEKPVAWWDCENVRGFDSTLPAEVLH